MNDGPLLEIRDLAKSFDGFFAVDGVEMAVAPGTIHSVIGPNGAGKTTFFRLLTGVHRATRGAVRFGGEDITGLRPHLIARRGLTQSFQLTNVFPRITVLESLQIAILARRRRSADFVTMFQRRVADEARELLARVGLEDAAEAEAQTLSHGDQRVLEVALALAARPRLLLLDEPTAGMSPFETDRMVELITALAEGGWAHRAAVRARHGRRLRNLRPDNRPAPGPRSSPTEPPIRSSRTSG